MNQTSTQTCFQISLQLFDAANSKDPRHEEADGKIWPKELLYSHRMSDMLARYVVNPSEAVQLACRAQHICRWQIPREDYPMNREGYHRWRTTLYGFHAATAAELMQQAGYEQQMIERVGQIIAKHGLRTNQETQLLEDVASLVFLEAYLSDFSAQKIDYSEEKWLGIIGKTWRKMSESARQFALSGKLRLPDALLPLISKAIQNPG